VVLPACRLCARRRVFQRAASSGDCLQRGQRCWVLWVFTFILVGSVLAVPAYVLALFAIPPTEADYVVLARLTRGRFGVLPTRGDECDDRMQLLVGTSEEEAFGPADGPGAHDVMEIWPVCPGLVNVSSVGRLWIQVPMSNQDPNALIFDSLTSMSYKVYGCGPPPSWWGSAVVSRVGHYYVAIPPPGREIVQLEAYGPVSDALREALVSANVADAGFGLALTALGGSLATATSRREIALAVVAFAGATATWAPAEARATLLSAVEVVESWQDIPTSPAEATDESEAYGPADAAARTFKALKIARNHAALLAVFALIGPTVWATLAPATDMLAAIDTGDKVLAAADSVTTAVRVVPALLSFIATGDEAALEAIADPPTAIVLAINRFLTESGSSWGPETVARAYDLRLRGSIQLASTPNGSERLRQLGATLTRLEGAIRTHGSRLPCRQPGAVAVFGPPGVGKSTMASRAAVLAAAHKFRRRPADVKIARMGDTKHDDSLFPDTEVAIFDDPDRMADVKLQAEAIQRIHQITGGEPVLLNKAALEEKGAIAQVPFVVVTSNNELNQVAGAKVVTDPMSLARRFPLVVRVTNEPPSYVRSDGTIDHGAVRYRLGRFDPTGNFSNPFTGPYVFEEIEYDVGGMTLRLASALVDVIERSEANVAAQSTLDSFMCVHGLKARCKECVATPNPAAPPAQAEAYGPAEMTVTLEVPFMKLFLLWSVMWGLSALWGLIPKRLLSWIGGTYLLCRITAICWQHQVGAQGGQPRAWLPALWTVMSESGTARAIRVARVGGTAFSLALQREVARFRASWLGGIVLVVAAALAARYALGESNPQPAEHKAYGAGLSKPTDPVARGTVSLRMVAASGKTYFFNGFLVAPGVLMTCNHCVDSDLQKLEYAGLNGVWRELDGLSDMTLVRQVSEDVAWVIDSRIVAVHSNSADWPEEAACRGRVRLVYYLPHAQLFVSDWLQVGEPRASYTTDVRTGRRMLNPVVYPVPFDAGHGSCGGRVVNESGNTVGVIVGGNTGRETIFRPWSRAEYARLADESTQCGHPIPARWPSDAEAIAYGGLTPYVLSPVAFDPVPVASHVARWPEDLPSLVVMGSYRETKGPPRGTDRAPHPLVEWLGAEVGVDPAKLAVSAGYDGRDPVNYGSNRKVSVAEQSQRESALAMALGQPGASRVPWADMVAATVAIVRQGGRIRPTPLTLGECIRGDGDQIGPTDPGTSSGPFVTMGAKRSLFRMTAKGYDASPPLAQSVRNYQDLALGGKVQPVLFLRQMEKTGEILSREKVESANTRVIYGASTAAQLAQKQLVGDIVAYVASAKRLGFMSGVNMVSPEVGDIVAGLTEWCPTRTDSPLVVPADEAKMDKKNSPAIMCAIGEFMWQVAQDVFPGDRPRQMFASRWVFSLLHSFVLCRALVFVNTKFMLSGFAFTTWVNSLVTWFKTFAVFCLAGPGGFDAFLRAACVIFGDDQVWRVPLDFRSVLTPAAWQVASLALGYVTTSDTDKSRPPEYVPLYGTATFLKRTFHLMEVSGRQVWVARLPLKSIFKSLMFPRFSGGVVDPLVYESAADSAARELWLYGAETYHRLIRVVAEACRAVGARVPSRTWAEWHDDYFPGRLATWALGA